MKISNTEVNFLREFVATCKGVSEFDRNKASEIVDGLVSTTTVETIQIGSQPKTLIKQNGKIVGVQR